MRVVSPDRNMILYKYLPPARTDIILNFTIRFTQYGDFNDPFELNPNINKITEENEIKDLVKKDFVKLIEQEYHNNAVVQTLISKEAFIQLAKMGEEFVKNAVVDIEPSIVAMLPGMLQKTANSLLGALSLSEVCDHELMWSHYAEEHKGYVIGFDSSHSFFNQKKSPVDELRHLRKIDYRETPPEINLMKASGAEIFFVKSSRWKYEAEWRMLLPLSDSAETIDKQPFPIYLFAFYPEAVNRIIFGARMNAETKDAIKSKLMINRELSHVELYEARLDSSSYGIIIEKEKG